MSSLNIFGHEWVVDNFAGGGGASEGIEQALGRPVDLAINHDETAIAVHTANHPDSQHSVADVWDVDPEQATNGMPVGLAWFSPDCRHHSKAKGGRPVSKRVRGLAWVAARWAARVKPRVIILENVEEFLDWGPLIKDVEGNCRPDPARKGQTFRGFVRALKRHGYEVDWRILRACDYGAPTIRKRLFLIARRDGLPIVWPKPTHADPAAPAVQRGKLQPWRTAAECIDWSIPCQSIFDRKRPLADNTLKRIAKGVMRYVVDAGEPFIVPIANYGNGANLVNASSEPLRTITAWPKGGSFALVAPTLVQTGYGERPGQEPRALDLHRPLGTVVAGGQKHALVSAFLSKHFTGVVGDDLRNPLPTVTATDHNALTAVSLLNLKGSDRGGSDITLPMPTCAGGTHAAAVAALLAPDYTTGAGGGHHDVVTVMIDGEQYVIVDIGMRMLQPHELAAAQGFPADYQFSEVEGRPVPKYQQVRLIGNSVCPPLARALVEANFTHEHQFMPKFSKAA